MFAILCVNGYPFQAIGRTSAHALHKKMVGICAGAHMRALDDCTAEYFRLLHDIGLGETAGECREIAEAYLSAGADPFDCKDRLAEILPRVFNTAADGDEKEKERVEDETDLRVRKAQAAYTARHAAAFDAVFGDDFSIADLRGRADFDGNANGDTGLTLAARARRLDIVLQRAAAGDEKLAAEDLASTSSSGRTLASLALSRGDFGVLMAPAYWLAQDDKVFEKMPIALDVAEMQHTEYKTAAAALGQASLRQHKPSAGLKLKPKGPQT
jgi:hypothetical protein